MTAVVTVEAPSELERRLGGRIHVVFQPILDLRTGQIFGYEALARSDATDFTSPIRLFSTAVELELCVELGRFVRRLAIQACRGAPLFLNVHPVELEGGTLLHPEEPLYAHDAPVFIEITESMPLGLRGRATGTIAELRGLGVGLAVDDLGAGYSNLRFIADLAPEIVKLDRGLVKNLAQDQRLRRLVHSIVRLCGQLGAEVVAEGIETVDELRAVRDSGASFGQGFLIAHPEFPPPQVSSQSRITFPAPPSAR